MPQTEFITVIRRLNDVKSRFIYFSEADAVCFWKTLSSGEKQRQCIGKRGARILLQQFVQPINVCCVLETRGCIKVTPLRLGIAIPVKGELLLSLSSEIFFYSPPHGKGRAGELWQEE